MTESISKKPSQDFREGTSVTHWGVVKTTVVDGKISKIEPIPEDRRPSPNLKALAELPYAPSRIRYPMVRESYLKEGIASRDRRGEDKWIRVSWEEALDLIASELKRVYSEYGPSAIFGQSYGWKSPGTVNSASTLQRRLLSLSGGYVSGVNSYSTAAIGTILPYVVLSPRIGMLFLKTASVLFFGARIRLSRMTSTGQRRFTTTSLTWKNSKHQALKRSISIRSEQKPGSF